jgi:selenide,water dikinase
MTALNAAAAEAMRRVGVRACTDITGFGLLGHACEMAAASGTGLVISASALPLLPGVLDLAAQGLIPAGAHANRSYLCARVNIAQDIPLALQDVMFDPQTSGGLLMAVPKERSVSLLEELHASGVTGALIGEVTAAHPGKIRVVS